MATYGNDSITGLAAGGLPDDCITNAEIADDAVQAAQLADDAVVQAAIADEAVDEARLQISNAGSNGQYLSKQSGNTGGLTWATVTTSPTTTQGDVIFRGSSADERLAKGTAGQLLQMNSGATAPEWATVSGAQMGKIVCNTTTSAANSSSTTLADSNLSASLTPTASTSKIWVNIQQHVVVQEGTATYDSGNPDNRASIAINPFWTKDGGSNWTQLASGGNDAGGAWSFGLDMRHEVGNGLSRIKGFVCHSFLIDHDTTNAVTVKTQFKCGLSGMNVTVQGGGRSSITLIEVLNP